MKRVLVFGDSLLSSLQVYDDFHCSYHVESYPGLLARDAQELLMISLKEDVYDIVVLCLGTNDLGHGLLPQDVVDTMLNLHLLIRAVSPGKIVAVNLHTQFSAFNELLGEKSSDDVEFLSFFYELEPGDLGEDNFHLSKQGREHFAESMEDLVNEIID